MARWIAGVLLLPFLTGCVTVNRYSILDAQGFGLAADDAGITGTILTIAACSGAIGGITVWLAVSTVRRRWTSPKE